LNWRTLRPFDAACCTRSIVESRNAQRKIGGCDQDRKYSSPLDHSADGPAAQCNWGEVKGIGAAGHPANPRLTGMLDYGTNGVTKRHPTPHCLMTEVANGRFANAG
jgi:hypothetical protein